MFQVAGMTQVRAWTAAVLWCLMTWLIPANAARAENLSYYLPEGVTYDPAIPVPADVLGHEVGDFVVRPDVQVAYMQAVANASNRVALEIIGYSHERRPILLLTITAPENHARIEDIRTTHLKLSDPSADQAVSDTMPSITWLGFGVHGDELSSMDAAVLTVYHLAAAQDEATATQLRNSVILLVPALNPDGFGRASEWINIHHAAAPVADLQHREHNGAWPRGRTNHYWFDLNRQWLARTQPESWAWTAAYQRWKPTLHIDFHEMNPDATYFFSPGIPAQTNPYIPESSVALQRRVADYAQRYLDGGRELYFSEEFFDDYNPAMGSNYPLLNGAVAFLFENRGFTGRIAESPNGDITLPSRIRRHFRIAVEMAKAGSDLRETLLSFHQDFFRQAMAAADRDEVAGYVFKSPGDPVRLFHFLEMLDRHGIDVRRVARTIRADGVSFESSDSYVVDIEQPEYRIIRNIFETRTDFGDVVFYDASTWTMPLAYGLTYAELTSLSGDALGVAATPEWPETSPPPAAPYAYVFDWTGYYAPRALTRILDAGGSARVATQGFTVETHAGPQTFRPGAIIVPLAEGQSLSEEDLNGLMATIAAEDGVAVFAATTGRTGDGIDFGGNYSIALEMPRPLLLTGDPVRFYDAGELWHLMDWRMHIPVSLRDADRLRGIDLTRYTHIILPDGDYGRLADSDVQMLDAWVKAGGTLVAVKRAALWAVRNGFFETPVIDDFAIVGFGAPNIKEAKDGEGPVRFDYADKEAIEQAERIRGAIFMTDVDITHPLGFGYVNRNLPSYRENRVILGLPKNPFATVARYTDNPLLSGYVSPDNLEKIKGAAAVIAERHGRGTVVLYSDNPAFRAFWYGTSKLFLNSLFFSKTILGRYQRFAEEDAE